MPGFQANLLLTGLVPQADPPLARLACLVEGGGQAIFWGSEANTRNIDAILAAGFPCLVVCDWQDPPPWARDRGQRFWVSEETPVLVR
jgi:hypothetical protein